MVHAAVVPGAAEAAVVIPYSMSLFWLLFFSLPSSMVVVGVAIMIREHSPVALLIVIGCVVLDTYLLVQLCRRKIVRGYVALSPVGIYHRSWGFTSFAPWEHVFGIEPRQGDGQIISVMVETNTESWSRRTARFVGEDSCDYGLSVRGLYLSTGPALAYYALQFYFLNPEARSELGCDAGVERLRQVDIPALPLHEYKLRAAVRPR
jgi:hypothetical protein